jgi:hypothetical protein
MDDDRYMIEKLGDGWMVYEELLGQKNVRLSGLTEWQAKAICAILNKGK